MRTQDLADVAATRRLARDGVLRERRVAQQIRVVELAGLLGVTPATLSRWENGVRAPSADDALRWVRALRSLETAGNRKVAAS
jgi:transcriptional regulator with XRE-family HTH domain